MKFEQKVAKVCQEKGWKFLGIEGGLVFVKDRKGKVFGIREEVLVRL